MTPEENKILGFLASRVVSNIAQATTSCILYGVYLAVFLASSRLLLQSHSLAKRGSKISLLLFLSLILFISASLRTSSWLSFIVTQIYTLFGSSDILSIGARRRVVKARVRKFDIILAFCRAINLIISDLIAIWRAWVLYRTQLWPRILMAVVFVVNVGTLLAVPFLNVTISGNQQGPVGGKTYARLLSASSFVSSVTNILATFFIGVQAWHHRREIVSRLRRRAVDKIFRILIESGLAFAVLQLVNAILALAYLDAEEAATSRELATGIFDEIVISAAAIYPVLVILLVQGHKTVVQSTIYGMDLGHPTGSMSEEGNLTTIEFSPKSQLEAPPVENLEKGRDGEDVQIREVQLASTGSLKEGETR